MAASGRKGASPASMLAVGHINTSGSPRGSRKDMGFAKLSSWAEGRRTQQPAYIKEILKMKKWYVASLGILALALAGKAVGAQMGKEQYVKVIRVPDGV